MNILIYLRIDYASVIKIRIRIVYFIMKIYSLWNVPRIRSRGKFLR